MHSTVKYTQTWIVCKIHMLEKGLKETRGTIFVKYLYYK